MKKYMLLILGLFVFTGCASTVTVTVVEDNTFISRNIPKRMIEVSDELPFISAEKKNRSSMASSGAEVSTGISMETYFFRDYARNRGLIILVEKFRGTAGKWRMRTPDYSSRPGLIGTDSIEMNGKLYSTGIYVKSKKNKQFIRKAYGRVDGSKNNIRFQIFYFEELNISLPTAKSPGSTEEASLTTFIEEFSSRADASFTILPYTAKNTQSSEVRSRSQHTSKIKKKEFVNILEPDVVFSYGQVKFTVNRGDVLEVVTTKTCRGGIGECWIVRHVSSGESGAVRAKQMHSYHNVYTAFEPEINDPGSQEESRLRTYIEIKEPDKIHKGRKVFLVTKGDKLEVLRRKTCKSGEGECWGVRDLRTGIFGYVKADSMRSKHIIYEKAETK